MRLRRRPVAPALRPDHALASGRGHRMFEQWHPLGLVGIITAFNFPVAVWAWNAMLAAVCGDTVVWKPSHADAADGHRRARASASEFWKPTPRRGVFSLVIGGGARRRRADDRRPPPAADLGHRLDPHGPRRSARWWRTRLGRTLLELGGNNAHHRHGRRRPRPGVRAVLFGAVGTAGQRCTTTRRLIVHEAIAAELVRAARQRLPQHADRRPAGRRDADGPADRRARRGEHDAGARADQGRGRPRSWAAASEIDRPGFFVEPTLVRGRRRHADRLRGDLRADPLRHSSSAISTRPSGSTTTCRRGSPRRSSRQHARGRALPVAQPAATAASPT